MPHTTTYHKIKRFHTFYCIDEVYNHLITTLLNKGINSTSRLGDVKSLPITFEIDVSQAFPLISLRKMPFKNIIREFLFDIGFNSNIEALGKAKHFWAAYADQDGYLGASAYNRFFRKYPNLPKTYLEENEFRKIDFDVHIDQISETIRLLEKHRDTRRACIFNGHPAFKYPENGVLPCHGYQVYTPWPDNTLNLMVTARS